MNGALKNGSLWLVSILLIVAGHTVAQADEPSALDAFKARQKTQCELHGLAMLEDLVPLTPSRRRYVVRASREQARKEWPNANSWKRGGRCSDPVIVWAKVRYCPECREIQTAWRDNAVPVGKKDPIVHAMMKRGRDMYACYVEASRGAGFRHGSVALRWRQQSGERRDVRCDVPEGTPERKRVLRMFCDCILQVFESIVFPEAVRAVDGEQRLPIHLGVRSYVPPTADIGSKEVH